MTCREVIEVLDRHLNAELPARQSRTIDGHLRQCPDCRAYVATYRQTTRLARTALAPTDDPIDIPMPERLVDAILESQRDPA